MTNANFKVSHDLRIIKTSTGANLLFKLDVGNYQYKDIKVEIEKYEVKELIKGLTEYLKQVERDNINEVEQLRSAFNYSNSKITVLYEKPNQ